MKKYLSILLAVFMGVQLFSAEIITLENLNLNKEVKTYTSISCGINKEKATVYGSTTQFFDANGRITKIEKYQPKTFEQKQIDVYLQAINQDSSDLLTWISEYMYNGQNLIEIKNSNLNTGSTRLESRVEISYNDQKKSKTIKYYNFRDRLQHTERYVYDEENRLLRYGKILPNKDIPRQDKYEYDSDGNLLLEEIIDTKGYKSKKVEYMYNDGLLQEKLYFDSFSSVGFKKMKKTTYSYNTDGNIKNEIYFNIDYHTEKETLDTVKSYEYKENGDTGIVIHDNKGNSRDGYKLIPASYESIKHMEDNTIIYVKADKNKGLLGAEIKSYDKNGNLVKISQLDKNEKQTEGFEYKYDDRGNKIEQVEYLDANPIKKVIYTYDNSNNLLETTTFKLTEFLGEIDETLNAYSLNRYEYYQE